MKRLLLVPLLLSLGLPVQAKITKESVKVLEKAVLECDKYGHESCAARFLAMGGCSYAMAMNSDKEPIEAREIGDEVFMMMMKGNKISSQILWDENNKIKENIKSEAIARMGFCKSTIKEVAIKKYKEKTGKVLEGDSLKRAVNGFSWVYLYDIEKLREE